MQNIILVVCEVTKVLRDSHKHTEKEFIEIINIALNFVLCGTGLSMAPPEGFFVGVYARSGLSSKEGLRPANCVGVCDEDYRGEYIVAVHNDSDVCRTVKHGDRIAQIILQKRYDMDFEEVAEITFDEGILLVIESRD